jgi:hypothetical protein
VNERKKLSDILRQAADRDRLTDLWNLTAAAEERGPLPPGEYTFRILTGELFTSKGGTPGYKLALEVTEGEHEGRRAWHDLWLTAAALPMAKRDLAKIGVKDLEQLERPLPPGILLRGKLAIRRDDDGNESNRLVRFECVGIEKGDAFEPEDEGADRGHAVGPAADFPFGANEPPSGGEGAAPSPNATEAGANGEPPNGTDGAATGPKPSRKRADAAGTEGGAGR